MRNILQKIRLKGKISKALYLFIFFSITPVTIAATLFTINLSTKANTQIKTVQSERLSEIQAPNFGANVYASLPDSVGEVKGAATAQDARFEIINQYLKKYDSPLAPYTQQIIDTSEKYNLDFRLIVAIAQQESNVCKKIPEDSHNCWGWGIHSKGTLKFDSYEDAIYAVAKGLKEEYVDRGYTTPEQIMLKYTPSSNGSWAKGVSQFLQEME